MTMSSKRIKGCKVMLCTLSMLSNHFLYKFTTANPIKTLIVDEASQIEIGDYIPVFSKFSGTIRKTCFIGDDKQCKCFCIGLFCEAKVYHTLLVPPYGQEDLQDLQSIFEISHLRAYATFLNTQCMFLPACCC